MPHHSLPMRGSGAPWLKNTIVLTVLVNELGHFIALVLLPSYVKPHGDKELISWLVAINTAPSGHLIEVYDYNFPKLSGWLTSKPKTHGVQIP